MSIDLLVPSVPPVHDAIGEYTVCLAQEMSRRCDVRILTNRDIAPDVVEGVDCEACFRLAGPNRFTELTSRLLTTTADAVVLQYNPFAWGKRGWVPGLTAALKRWKRGRTDVRLGIMFHETYTMSPGWKSLIMRQYQRRQFSRMVELADVCMFSTGIWAVEEAARRPSARVIHLPVGSNLPLTKISCSQARHELGIGPDELVLGVFGGAHPSRLKNWIEDGVNRIAKNSDLPVVLLHVGGDRIEWNVESVKVVATGRLPAVKAAEAIAGMDLLLNPFADGISGRRGSAIAALQHGVPVVSTIGKSTEPFWREFDGNAVFLVDATKPREWSRVLEFAVGSVIAPSRLNRSAAKKMYDRHFAWPVLADTLICGLDFPIAN